MSSGNCRICSAPFDEFAHRDCGGDCLLCMVLVGGDTDLHLLLREQVGELTRRLEAAERELTKAVKAANHWADEAIRYKNERNTARRERDALAAHVERLTEILDEAQDLMPISDIGNRARFWDAKACRARRETPETSLARIIAEKQAEKLDDMASQAKRWGPSDLAAEAIMIRRQAGEGSDETDPV